MVHWFCICITNGTFVHNEYLACLVCQFCIKITFMTVVYRNNLLTTIQPFRKLKMTKTQNDMQIRLATQQNGITTLYHKWSPLL